MHEEGKAMGRRNTGSWKETPRGQGGHLARDYARARARLQLSPGLGALWAFASVSEQQAALEILSEGRTPAKVVEVACNAGVYCDGLIEHFANPRIRPACRKGCAWRCMLTVTTTVPEVLGIVSYLQTTLDADAVAALTARVQEAAAVRTAISAAERYGDGYSRVRQVCPLLVDNRCSAYPARPLTCCGWNSTSAVACEWDARSPSDRNIVHIDSMRREAGLGVQDGLKRAVTAIGCDGTPVELITALAIAVSEPDATKRWLAGERLFVPSYARGLSTATCPSGSSPRDGDP
jgi:hypothetical protein